MAEKTALQTGTIHKLYNGEVLIDFKERDWGDNKIHEYRLVNSDGTLPKEKLLSVTGVTKLIDKSDVLIPWAIKLMGKYLIVNHSGKIVDEVVIEVAKKEWRKAKEEAADIGTEIHDWIERHLNGEKQEMPAREQTRNGVLAFLKWMETHNMKFKEIERVVYSKKFKYVGKMDAWGTEKKIGIIIDHKSSKGIYSEMRYQLALYWNAYEEEMGPTFEKGYIVKYGKEDGEFEVLEITKADYKKDLKAALGLLAAKRREMELKKHA